MEVQFFIVKEAIAMRQEKTGGSWGHDPQMVIKSVTYSPLTWKRTEEMTKSMKGLPHKYEDLSLEPQSLPNNSGGCFHL